MHTRIRPGLGLLVVAAIVSAADANDRAVHVRLEAQITGDQSGETRFGYSNLLTDTSSDGVVIRITDCVGGRLARVHLNYRKIENDTINLWGQVELLNDCGAPQVIATQTVSQLVVRDADAMIPVNLSHGDTWLVGSLLLENAIPSCEATYVTWRAHMDIVDHNDFDDEREGHFDTERISFLMHPGAPPDTVTMYRVVGGETSGALRSDMIASADHLVSVTSILRLQEWGSLWEDADDIDAMAANTWVFASGTSRVLQMRAIDEGRVNVLIGFENHGQPPTCESVLRIQPEPSIDISEPWPPRPQPEPSIDISEPWSPRPLPASCEAILRGCFSRVGSGWIRFDNVTCTGSGAARTCRASGAGQGNVCTGGTWTFTDATVDADCMGARLVLACLPRDAAIVRRTPTGVTIRRESRTALTQLDAGGTCQ